MGDPVHVLVYGSIDEGVCDVYRLGMYRERLAALGVEMRTWGDFNDYLVRVPAGYESRVAEAIRDGVAEIDRAPLDWADVILFRRWYGLSPACAECDVTAPSEATVAAHCAASGHAASVPDRIVAPLLASFELHPEILRGRAIIYETDDDLLASLPWVGFHRRLQPDRWLIERMARRADLVTVATPVLARSLRRFNDEVRVVRNAIDPAWYADPPTGPDPQGDPRILYYGAGARVRDYAICREAIDDAARREPGVRRVWLGESERPDVVAMVDEALPYVNGLPAFARALVEARPDIGVAPVLGDDYDRARSELHWLEYSLAGAATIASRTSGGGPYDVLRDGVDGLLARNRVQWREQVRRLVGSRTLRDELAGRARERVLAEYSADRRAEEWADAFRWAAEHAGRGVLARTAAGLDRTRGVAGGAADGGSGNASRAEIVPRHVPLTGSGVAPGIRASSPGSRDLPPDGRSRDAAASKAATVSGLLRVLVVGSSSSVSDALRFAAPAAALRQHGIELELWPGAPGPDALDLIGAAIARSDLLVLRRSYGTWDRCLGCGARALMGGLDDHHGRPGHEVLQAPFGVVRPLVDLVESERAAIGRVGIVYDTDDDLLAAARPTAGSEDWLETDLVRRMLALADLVTTTTPVLAGRLAPHTRADVRVIRNALDPAWYAGAPAADLTGDPRVVYHGVAARLRDYGVARPAVDALAAELPRLRRIWLGAAHEPRVVAAMDEVRPWVDGVPAFAASLVAARPDIGLAPLVDEQYSRSRSELHWLEYALAGAPAVVTGFADGAPYDVVRDGVDGLVARTPDDWHRHLRALAISPDLRAEIAGRARERVLAQYTVDGRAGEWAEAYRHAAAHPGIGRSA